VTLVSGLEVRYRRLLRWFPADHRRRHGDEMLGVLLAAAPAGKDRPGFRDTSDLMLSAARIRLRPGRALSDRAGWRDALAVFSFIAPVLILAALSLSYVAANLLAEAAGQGSLSFGLAGLSNWNLGIVHPVLGTIAFLLVTGQGATAVLVLLGLRRCAALAAAATVVYYGAEGFAYAPSITMLVQEAASLLFQLMAPLAVIVALLVSPGPRYGRRLMRPAHWVLAGAVLLPLAGYQWAAFGGGWIVGAGTSVRLILAVAPAALLLLIAAAWVASPAGKRFAVLLALLGYPLLQVLVYRLLPQPLTGTVPFEVGLQAAAVLLPAVLMYRVWRTKRRAGDGEGTGTA
jgi:hypothetical protein